MRGKPLLYSIVGKKGSNEIASFVLDYIGKMAEKGVKKFVFYSDNSGGQNHNRYVFGMYALASARYTVEIVHHFLEVGHTQNEGDSMHALIEKLSKGLTIFSPLDWTTVIRTTRSRQKPYNVHVHPQNSHWRGRQSYFAFQI